MNTQTEDKILMQKQVKECSIDIVDFINLYQQYFDVNPKKSTLQDVFSKDADLHFAEMMHSTGKNPFITRHPELERLKHLRSRIHLNRYRSKVWEEIVEDQSGCVSSIGEVKIFV